MVKYISTICVTVLMSLFLFPIELKAFPGMKSKKFLAAVGLVWFFINLGKYRTGRFSKDMVILSLLAVFVSLAGLIAVTYNETPDYAYATYITSMWVWLGAAYVVVHSIRLVHGSASIWLAGNYFIAVCLIQCIMALWIDSSIELKQAVDSVIEQGQDFLNSHNVERLYGIGASLDVAGSRFAAALVLLAFFLLSMEQTRFRSWMFFYILAFVFIAVVGNMIARTTTVGLLLAIGYLLYKSDIWRLKLSAESRKLWLYLGGVLLLAISLCVYLYQQDAIFRSNLRFAFEGFFSLIEKGEWQVSSNEKLETMYVFPDNLKTWLIGDGYFDNPYYADPYFTGRFVGGYYMGTDVGYLRFIFYSGLVGLAAITAVLWKACLICRSRFNTEKELFVLFLLVNLLVWFKVSTDIFLIFALFLMVNQDENDAYNRKISIANENTL